MATKSKASEMADHYIAVLAEWAEVTRKPLFGAIALRRNDLVFGMIWKGALYFKTDERSVQEYDAADWKTEQRRPRWQDAGAEVLCRGPT